METNPKKNILLVEDQAVIGMHQKIELEKRQYCVNHVLNGEDAISAISNNGVDYDLILMDIDLGSGMNGIEAAKKICENTDIPVVFHSSHTSPDIVAQTEEVTSYGYVVKNSGITVLDASLKMAFKLYEAKNKERVARKRVEKDLERSEHYFDQVVYHMLEGFLLVEPIIDSNNTITDFTYLIVNPAVEKITGIKREDYIGRRARDLFNDNIEDVYFEKYNEVYQSGLPAHFVEKFDELEHWYEVSIYKVDDHKLAITFHNITEYVEFREALKLSEFKYRSIFDNMEDEIHFWKVVRDEDGVIINWQLQDANPAALRSWNKNREDVLFRKTDQIFTNGDPINLFMPIVQKIFETGEPHSWETYFEDTDQHLLMTSVPFGDYFVTTGIDITYEKLLQQRLKEKEAIVKEVLHRVKNNIGSLISILKIQAETIENPEVLDAIVEATGRIETMGMIYEKLLISDKFKEVPLKKYVNDLVYSIMNLASDFNKPEVELQIDDIILEADKLFPVGAIINELMTNSLKHAFKGISDKKINLEIHEKDGCARLTYQDNGSGLPQGFNANEEGFGFMLIGSVQL